MDPLKSLVDNIPDWVKRIDELSGQIEQRQLDLAKFQEDEPPSSARSIRNVGSTESLKPKDDGAAYPTAHRDVTPPPPPPLRTKSTQKRGAQAPPSPNSDPKTPSSIQRQTNEVVAAAQKRARATLRRAQKTDSMISADGPAPTYKSRRMFIVYYDSYVQFFFEELVKFVSAQRNLMRKAKMAAKVAEIKRLAELEMPDDDDDDDDVDDALQPGDAMIAADPNLPARKPRLNTADELKLRYVSTQQMGPTTRLPNAGLVHMRGTDRVPNPPLTSSFGRGFGYFDQAGGDVFDDVDQGLEFVQGMCEHAAHQFLRDGECSEEIEKIKRRLRDTNEIANTEMERVLKENPDALKPPAQPKIRSYRPSSMRRDPGASSTLSKKAKLEVDDEGVQDM